MAKPSKILTEKPQRWSDVVGMPDAWDKKNIEALIAKFKKRKFKLPEDVGGKVVTGQQYITIVVSQARQSHSSDDIFNPFNVKSKETEMRALFTMPHELDKELSESYPTISRDKEHTIWFAQNFPEFRIANKI